MNYYSVKDDTPIAMLTVGQLREYLKITTPAPLTEQSPKETKYVYGIAGIARLFGCSLPTAHRIKKSGRIDGAIKQVGRKIITDADLALELAGRKTGGRR